MENFALILFCLSAGVLVSKLMLLPKEANKGIQLWLLYIALPALALRYIPSIEWSRYMLLPCFAPLLVWAGARVFISLYARRKGIDSINTAVMTVTAGLGNTAFLGFPLISAYYGEDQLHHAILFDQLTFLIFSTLVVILVFSVSPDKKEKPGFKQIAKKVLFFPPFIACLAALLLSGITDISFAYPFLDSIVATLSPLALFSIGLQLDFSGWKKEVPKLSAVLFYKLLLAPLLVLGLALWMNVSGNLAKISLLEAAMPSHITASILLSEHNMNPKLCSLIVTIGILIGLLTTFLWNVLGNLLL